MTEQPVQLSWQEQQLDSLYNAILQRMIFTYMLNELVKSGIKTPMKDGIIEILRAKQKACNLIITNTVRRVDRGIQE